MITRGTSGAGKTAAPQKWGPVDVPLFLALFPVLIFSACVHRVSESENRTVIFLAREIHTMDPQQPSAQALVMRDGKFAFVGTEKAAFSFAGTDATIERWPDSTIVPGLIDAHGHLASLGRTLSILSLQGTTSEAAALEKVKVPPKSAYQGDWLLGRGTVGAFGVSGSQRWRGKPCVEHSPVQRHRRQPVSPCAALVRHGHKPR